MSGKPVCVADFEHYAKTFLPKSVYDYYRSGADDQETLADNVAAFSRQENDLRLQRACVCVCVSVYIISRCGTMLDFVLTKLNFSETSVNVRKKTQ